MSRAHRQSILLKILRQGPVRTQHAVVALLAEEGISTTQATLSRDFLALGVIKTPAGYQLPGIAARHPMPPVATAFFGDVVHQVDVGETIIVVRTATAHADAVALRVDELSDPDLLGTIAGDDTIFVATRSPKAAERIATTLFGYDASNHRN